MNKYIGHDSQLFGVEEHRLVGGKGDGLRLYEVHNGQGLDLTISPDRNLDITRLRYKGINMSYMSPCGYVAPAYYDKTGTNWLNSFTAGFLTTCGLNAVGTPCIDDGEELSLHGNIANTPCENSYFYEEDGVLKIKGTTKDETIFGRKLRLTREIAVSTYDNSFVFTDTITNTGSKKEALEILYHMNMGYPLLDEDSIIDVPSVKVLPRDDNAAGDIENWMKIQKPTDDYVEKCYYHKFDQKSGESTTVSIYQPKLHTKLSMTFDANSLDGFVEWKMFGVRDYALGLECGNCYPDGRDVMRKTGMLKFIEPGEEIKYSVKIELNSD